MRRDFAAHILEIGIPVVGFVADIVARRAAGQRHCGRPQRIVGRGHQHLVAAVEQALHGHHNQLGSAVADEDVIHAHAGDLLLLRIMHDRLARGEQAFGIGIAGGIGQVVDHVLLDFLRRLEAERRQVADVQLDDAVAVFLHLLGARHHRAADVVADVGQLGGLLYGAHSHPIDRTSFGGFRWFHGVLSVSRFKPPLIR
jgi:hypothetical protein